MRLLTTKALRPATSVPRMMSQSHFQMIAAYCRSSMRETLSLSQMWPIFSISWGRDRPCACPEGRPQGFTPTFSEDTLWRPKRPKGIEGQAAEQGEPRPPKKKDARSLCSPTHHLQNRPSSACAKRNVAAEVDSLFVVTIGKSRFHCREPPVLVDLSVRRCGRLHRKKIPITISTTMLQGTPNPNQQHQIRSTSVARRALQWAIGQVA